MTELQKSRNDGPDKLEDQNPRPLIEKAIEGNADVETIERLLQLQERWEANQAKKAFDHAMSALRKDLPVIEKTREGHNYKYESLTDIIQQIEDPMMDQGLSFRWETESNENGVRVTCVLSHELGHVEKTSLSAPLDGTGSKNVIQSIGSTVSYLQRYTLRAITGLAAGKDTDATIPAKPGPEEELNEWASGDKPSVDQLKEIISEESDDPTATLRDILEICEMDVDNEPIEWSRVPEKTARFLIEHPERRKKITQ